MNGLKWLLVAIAATAFAGCASGTRSRQMPRRRPTLPAATSSVPVIRQMCSSGAIPSVGHRAGPTGRQDLDAPVEDMVAAGKSPTQLARDIEGVLGEYVRGSERHRDRRQNSSERSPSRSASWARRRSHARWRIAIAVTVLDAMIEVGGLTPQRGRQLVPSSWRWENGKQVDIPVRLHDLLNKGKIEANMSLQPGDVLIIQSPSSSRVVAIARPAPRTI